MIMEFHCMRFIKMVSGLKTMSLALLLLSLLRSTVATSAPADAPLIDDCCTFDVLQSSCSDTFVLGDDNALACTLTAQTSLPDGSCIEPDGPEEVEHDGRISAIELLAAEPILDIRCRTGSETDGIDSQCTDYRESTFIALKIKLRINAENVVGVVFDLNSTAGNCHHLTLPNGTRGDPIVNRTLSYTGFVGLHPGSEYALQATTILAEGSRGGYSKLVFRVPDCWTIDDFEEDYYCSRPSPANWKPKLIVPPNSVDVTFTIWPEISTFEHYNVYIFLGDSFDDKIERESLYTEDTINIKTMEVHGRLEKVMHYDFNIDVPGLYSLAVLPQPDTACTSDSHWGGRKCMYENKSVQLTRDVLVTDEQVTDERTGSDQAPEPPPSKPHFTTQLTPELSLRNGDNLNLSAKVAGYPLPRITWYRDGTPLKGGPDYKMANKNGAVSLHLPKCTQDDGGVYACLATNPSGQDSTSSNVTVSAIPKPTSIPTPKSTTGPRDLDPLYLGIILSLALFVILLTVSILCCCNDRTISGYLLQNCKDFFCYRDRPDLDAQTVTSSWVGNQYQPVPLETPSLPGMHPSTLDDIILLEGNTPPSTCSESTSDSMSQVLPDKTKTRKHGRGRKEHV